MALLRHYFVELQSPTNIHIILLHTKFLIDQFLFRCTVRFLWMRHLGSYIAHDIFSIIDWLFYNKQTQCKMQGAEWIGYVYITRLVFFLGIYKILWSSLKFITDLKFIQISLWILIMSNFPSVSQNYFVNSISHSYLIFLSSLFDSTY